MAAAPGVQLTPMAPAQLAAWSSPDAYAWGYIYSAGKPSPELQSFKVPATTGQAAQVCLFCQTVYK